MGGANIRYVVMYISTMCHYYGEDFPSIVMFAFSQIDSNKFSITAK